MHKAFELGASRLSQPSRKAVTGAEPLIIKILTSRYFYEVLIGIALVAWAEKKGRDLDK